MPTVDITGTIQDAAGNGVQGVTVTLTPEAPPPGGEEAIGGIGITLTPVGVQTDVNGDFTATAVQGFRYQLDIEAIGYSRDFRAPATATVRFDLLGLLPAFETIADYIDADGVSKLIITIKADPIATVRERFDVIALERSTTGPGGPFTPIASADPVIPILLQEGQTFYDVEIAADNTDYFRTRYENTTNGDTGQYSEPKLADSVEEALIMSVEELKELYLFGVDLTDGDGNPYPDRLFEHYIRSAVAWLEKELDIPILARTFTDELHDHYAADYGRWGYFQLRNFPIVIPDGTVLGEPFDPVTNPSPVQVSFQYPSQDSEVEILQQWVVVVEEGTTGVIQIVPGQGNIADVLLIPGSLMPLWSGAFGRVPGVWRFTYRAGFEVGDLPADLKHAIGMHASIGVFNIAGDLIAGAGIANISISVPGLNQNIGTTSSATNSGYGARIIEYQKELKEMLPNLRRYYGKGTRLVVA